MGILRPITQWATSPWGREVPIHIAWFLIWVAAIAGTAIPHRACHLRAVFRQGRGIRGQCFADARSRPAERIPRHSLAARLFHWIMAASMFTLLITAFLPKVGVQFDWVTYHWIAGTVLTVSIVFHIIHASSLAGLLGDLAGQGRPGRHAEDASAGSWVSRRRRREGSPSIRWRISSTTAPSLRPVCRQSEPVCS